MNTAALVRDPGAAAARSWDVVIVGGGIHGIALLHEASRRGLRALLIDRGDFGGETTFESLRIIHGGLRYLQGLDLPRFFGSVRERRWFLRSFPEFVRPLPCLMPLYGGYRRPAVMRIALLLNDLLSAGRNRDLAPGSRIPRSRILEPEATLRAFPEAAPEGLLGGAVWHDACAPDSQRLAVEMLRRATGLGAAALNYVEARQIELSGSRVRAVVATDLVAGSDHTFRAGVVVNAAGPWCRSVARSFDQDLPALFRPSLAWNVLFDRPAPSDHAIAVRPPGEGSRTYFLHPWKGRLLAGTGHAAWSGEPEGAAPTDLQIMSFVAELNAGIPGLRLDRDGIVRVFAGLLPVREDGTTRLSVRDVLVDHHGVGGPTGLWSLSGVKLTTARAAAAKVLNGAFPDAPRPRDADPLVPCTQESLWQLDADAALGRWPRDLAGIRQLAGNESVVHLDDLVLRRTTLWEQPVAAHRLGRRLCEAFDWDDSRRNAEMERLRVALQLPESIGTGSGRG